MSSNQEISEVNIQLENNANTSAVCHQAQLMRALQTRDLDSFSQLLQEAAGDVDGYFLVLACRNSDCTEFVKLLLQHGADPNTVNSVFQETPLHITAELGYHETLQLLLHDARIDVNALNGSHQTALHVVVNKCGEASNNDVARYRKCMGLLLDWPNNVKEWRRGAADLQHPLHVDTMDWLGNTALHYAAHNKDQDTILALLEHGSYIGSINHAGNIPISGIESETLEKFFNTCLKMPSDESLLFKYDFLVPAVDLHSNLMKNNLLSEDTDDVMMKLGSPSPEMDPLVQISLSPKLQHLLLHPILSSFIQLKWQLTKKFYYYSVAFYVLFVSLLTFITVHHYMTAHHEQTPFCWVVLTEVCLFKTIAFLLLAICCVCLIMKLLYYLLISPVQHLSKWKNYPQIILTLLVITFLFHGLGAGWNALTATTLFIAWTQLLLLTGEHPAVSVCFQLFKEVSCTFIKYLGWYSFLIMAFSLTFYVLFHDSDISERNTTREFFHSPLSSLFTITGMFVGGFETKFLPFDSATGTSHIIFILFTFFLILVLSSIFIGLAVSQILKVQRKAELVRLRAKVNAVSDTETWLLGNPLHIHLRMRRLYISRNTVIMWLVKCSVSLWLMCNWLRCFRNFHRSVMLFPASGYEHTRILFPLGNRSKVTCNYSMDHKVLLQAANIVQEKHNKTRQQLEYQTMCMSYDEHLKNIEASLVRIEALQQSVLQLLSSSKV